jgi:SPX domain protein involved in polyphosphate accumulation
LNGLRELFSRFELKYLINWRQMNAFKEGIAPFVVPDEHGSRGEYRIASLYYDSPDLRAYFEKINGYIKRFKVRIRTYGSATPDSTAFLEIKQRYDQALTKKRCALPLRDAYRFMDGDEDDIAGSHPEVLRELTLLRHRYRLQPTIVIAYQRQAFRGIYEPDLRVTFDTALKGDASDLTLESGGESGRYLLQPHKVVLEVKLTNRAPTWLLALLAKHECPIRRISKYCLGVERCLNLPPLWRPPEHEFAQALTRTGQPKTGDGN